MMLLAAISAYRECGLLECPEGMSGTYLAAVAIIAICGATGAIYGAVKAIDAYFDGGEFRAFSIRYGLGLGMFAVSAALAVYVIANI